MIDAAEPNLAGAAGAVAAESSGAAGTDGTAIVAGPDVGAAAAAKRDKAFRRALLRRRVLIRLGALVGFLGVWWLVTWLQLIKPLYLPSPGSVWEAFVQANSIHPIAPGVPRYVIGEQGYYLWEHLLSSLQRIGVGVGFALIFAPLLGFLMATIHPLGTIIEPYLNFLRALPPLGYLGILLVWFGIGDTSKIWLLFLAAFPPITMATINGVRGVREDRVNAALSLGATRLQAWRYVVLPSTLPDILSGIRIAVGFAWTTVVAAELNAGNPGIGSLAYLSGTELRSPLTIACIIVIGIAAITLDLGIKGLERALVPWRGKA